MDGKALGNNLRARVYRLPWWRTLHVRPQVTPEAQNIAIAEWMRWKEVHLCRVDCESGKEPIGIPPDIEARGPGIDRTKFWPIHNYHSDLNAIHKAEKNLHSNFIARYAKRLDVVTQGEGWHANSEQRCEALLRTLGKWPQ